MPGRERTLESNSGIDAGTLAILDRYRGQADPYSVQQQMHAADVGEQGGGAGIDIMVRIAATLDRLNQHMDRRSDRGPVVPYAAARAVPIQAQSSSAAATTLDPGGSLWAPKDGYAWHVVRLSCVGPACTGVSYFDTVVEGSGNIGSTGLNTVTGTAGNVITWEPRLLVMLPTSRLIAQTQGGAGTIYGMAVEVELPWLATYLM